MPIPYKVKVTVHSVTKGECPQGIKASDMWLIENGKTPSGMCAGAYASCSPAIRTFRLGGKHPWDESKDVTYVSCPDPKHWVIYEVKRLR
ncbi:TIGR04076 family protein [Chloroflexota bacterium]